MLIDTGHDFASSLNRYILPRVLSPKLQKVGGFFHGIGSLTPQTTVGLHIVFGSIVCPKAIPPTAENWHYIFVCGPHSSAMLDRKAKYLTDPGVLIRNFFRKPLKADIPVSFVPTWDASEQKGLKDSVEAAGIHYIDPFDTVEKVVDQIGRSELVLCESVSSAVVADALRVKWISIYGSRGREYQWQDWTGSLDFVWSPIDMKEFTLSWARDYAIPQLSAQSVLDARTRVLEQALMSFNQQVDGGFYAG